MVNELVAEPQASDASARVAAPRVMVALIVLAGIGSSALSAIVVIRFGDPHGTFFLVTTLVQVWSFVACGIVISYRRHGSVIGLVFAVIGLCLLIRTATLLPGQVGVRLAEAVRAVPFVLLVLAFTLLPSGERGSVLERTVRLLAIVTYGALVVDAFVNPVGLTDPCFTCMSHATTSGTIAAQITSRVLVAVTAALLVGSIIRRRAVLDGPLRPAALLGLLFAVQAIVAAVLPQIWAVPVALWVGLNAVGIAIDTLIAPAVLAGTVRAWLDSADVRASRLLRVVTRTRATARRSIQRDLHDGAQLRLLNAAMLINVTRARLATMTTESPPSPEGEQTTRSYLDDDLRAAADEVAAALAELRELTQGTPPAAVTRFGLYEALYLLPQRCPVPVTVEVERIEVAPAVAAAVYFAVVASLANTVRHANASKITICLTGESNDGVAMLRVEIRDDGIGGADMSAGTGLRRLAQRIREAGGTLEVDSVPHMGTAVLVVIPCESSSLTTRS